MVDSVNISNFISTENLLEMTKKYVKNKNKFLPASIENQERMSVAILRTFWKKKADGFKLTH